MIMQYAHAQDRTGGLALGHRLIKSHPNTDGGKFDRSEIVLWQFVISGSDGPEVFEFVEEALDEIAMAVEQRAEGRGVQPVRHRLDVGPSAARREGVAQEV